MPEERSGGAASERALTDAALRSAVDAAPDGIVVVDESGTIVFVNPMVERMFGYQRDDLVGRSVDLLVPADIASAHAAYRSIYNDQPRTRVMGSGLDLQGRKRSGAAFPVEISLSPVRSGDRVLVIAIVRDITERREAAGELERVRADLALVDERERIARDLHDTVVQRLFAVGLSLQATLARSGDGPMTDRVRLAIDDIDETIRDIRSAIFALHTRRPGGASLRDDVLGIVAESTRVLGFEPEVAFDGPVDSAASDAMHEHLSSTLREALSNVAKHAHATIVEVDVTIEQSHLVLRVRDDGHGITGQPGGGSGLANMAERAEDLGGFFVVTTPESGGTHLEWRVPIDRSRPAT